MPPLSGQASPQGLAGNPSSLLKPPAVPPDCQAPYRASVWYSLGLICWERSRHWGQARGGSVRSAGGRNTCRHTSFRETQFASHAVELWISNLTPMPLWCQLLKMQQQHHYSSLIDRKEKESEITKSFNIICLYVYILWSLYQRQRLCGAFSSRNQFQRILSLPRSGPHGDWSEGACVFFLCRAECWSVFT